MAASDTERYRKEIAAFVASDVNAREELGELTMMLHDSKLIAEVLERRIDEGSIDKIAMLNVIDFDTEIELDPKKLNGHIIAVLWVTKVEGPERLYQFPGVIEELMQIGLKKVSDEELLEKWVPAYENDKQLLESFNKEKQQKEKRKLKMIRAIIDLVDGMTGDQFQTWQKRMGKHEGMYAMKHIVGDPAKAETKLLKCKKRTLRMIRDVGREVRTE